MKLSHTVLAAATALFVLAPVASAQQQRIEGPHPTIGYANAVQVGNTVYLSGMVARGANMEEQVTNIFAQLKQALPMFNATINDVVKEVTYTTDMEALKSANAARLRAYGGHTPAATWVQIERLFMPQALVEIEFVVVPGSGKKN
jgi:2-iminobutanoate/2-iminopropanoate deaminase